MIKEAVETKALYDDGVSSDRAIIILYHILLFQQYEIKRLESELAQTKHDLIHDALTGLKTKAFFLEYLNNLVHSIISPQEEKRSPAHHSKNHSILFIDIDNFKTVNDTYGHKAGDFILKEVANILQTHIRPLDIAARYGGEEMVIMLHEIEEKEATMKAEQLRIAVKEKMGEKFSSKSLFENF